MKQIYFSIIIVLGVFVWNNVAHAACTSPAGDAGDITYATNFDVMVYCNSSDWIRMGPDIFADLPIGGLIGWWKMDEASGVTVSDSSGQANDGSLVGAAYWIPEGGVINGALVLPDTNGADHIEIPAATASTAFKGLPARTVSMWVYISWNEPFKILFDHGAASIENSCNDGHVFGLSSAVRLTFEACFGTTDLVVITDNLPLTKNTWHHIAMSWDGSENATGVKLYLNGNEISSYVTQTDGAGGYIPPANSEALRIGHSYFGRYDRLDEVRYYDRILTSSEIASLANYNTVPTLAAHWKFNESSGPTATDSGDLQRDATLVNMDTSTDWVSGKYGNAVDLDGIDDYIDTGETAGMIHGSDDASICAWVYWDDTAVNSDGAIYSQYEAIGGGFMLWVDDVAAISGRTNTVSFITEAPEDRLEGSSNLVTPQTWDHYCVSYKNNEFLRLYKNGVLDRELINPSSGIGLNSVDGRIGRDNDGTRPFLGKIDDVRLYRGALTVTQVNQVFENQEVSVCKNPDGWEGDLLYDNDNNVMTYCNGNEWVAMGPVPGPAPPDPCASSNSPAVGQLCNDGSYYAGEINSNKIFVQDTDQSSNIAWGSYNVVRGTTSLTDGADNTAILAGFGQSAHPAAYECDSLSVHGLDDWYLPARDELKLVYENLVDATPDDNQPDPIVPGFNTSGNWKSGYYWTSSEMDGEFAWNLRFSDGSTSGMFGNPDEKYYDISIRCVRKGYVPPVTCANPDGRAGDLTYDTNADVMVYCDGADWRRIGK